ncbi:hypothetical protein E5288_WYG011608 [Bos mutus]|uniref:Uncharacterized protein n=1 Tax=Bos mutus TaxID=72004 RepID=A0A6B0S6N1_9CETA|nr:hypothetical protein [Bos mutus]
MKMVDIGYNQKQRKDGNHAMEHSFQCTRSKDQSMPFRQSPSDIFSSTEDLEQASLTWVYGTFSPNCPNSDAKK